MYLKVIKDILEHYLIMLEKDEIDILSNIIKNNEKIDITKIIFINNILDRIWNNTLTNIYEFRNGKKFCFLVKNKEEYFNKFSKNNVLNIKLITEKDIIDQNIMEYGYIIKLDYKNSKDATPLLPIYFDKEDIDTKKINYEILSTYSIDTRMGFKNNIVKEIFEESKKMNIPYILIDKFLYKEKGPLLNKDDLVRISIILYDNYCKENNKDAKYSFENRVWIENKKIHKLILEYYEEKMLTFKELEKIVYKMYETLEQNLTKKIRK